MLKNNLLRKVVREGVLEEELLKPLLAPEIERLKYHLESGIYNAQITVEQRIETYSRLLALEHVLQLVADKRVELNNPEIDYDL